MPHLTRIALRTTASAASLGAFALGKWAEFLRALAGGDPASQRIPRETEEDGDGAGTGARLEAVALPRDPLAESPADETPANPAAPAGGDPDGASGTGAVPRRISNPKAARKVRKRTESAADIKRLEAKGRFKGARPAAAGAEPSPAELAETGEGRRPAPLGSTG